MQVLAFLVSLSLTFSLSFPTFRNSHCISRTTPSSKYYFASQLSQERSSLRLYAEQEPKSSAPTKKGFGVEKKKVVVEEEQVKDLGTKTYENQAKRGVPEYNIFIRPSNSTDIEWIPVGSMTIPRDTSVSKAVFEVEQELLKGAFKLYPKLRAFYELQGGAAAQSDTKSTFEYGSCLKAFPDEPIQILKREDAQSQKKNFFQNWLDKITNPLDTSELKNKGELTIKQ